MKASLIVALIAGCLAGVASAALTMTFFLYHQARTEAAKASTIAEIAPASTPRGDAPRPSPLELPSSLPAASPSSPSPEKSDPHPDFGAAIAEREIEHRQLLEAHRRDPVDRVWARAAQDAYTADLKALEKGLDMTVDAVDCRTTTCTARLTFASYGAAREKWQGLIGTRFAKGEECGTEITLEEPAEAEGRYSTEVYFSCDRAN